MNLFTNPSARQLRQLLIKAEKKHSVHEVVVDFDGEVLVDPQLRQPNLDLNKFKVHLQFSEHAGKALSLGTKRLKELLNSLLDDWKAEYNSITFQVFDCNPNR